RLPSTAALPCDQRFGGGSRSPKRDANSGAKAHFFNNVFGRSRSTSARLLYRDRRFDRGVRIVADQCKIFEFEIANALDRRVHLHARQRSTLASELFAGLLEMIL